MANFKIIPLTWKCFITERKWWKYYQGRDTWCHNVSVNRMKAVPCLCAPLILRQFHWSHSLSDSTQSSTDPTHLSNAQLKDIPVVGPVREPWINTRNYIPALQLLSIQRQWHTCAEPPNRSQNMKKKWQTGFSGNICIDLEIFPLVDIYVTLWLQYFLQPCFWAAQCLWNIIYFLSITQM